MIQNTEKHNLLDLGQILERAKELYPEESSHIKERNFRFWEAKGLLTENAARGPNNRKLYNEGIIAELVALKKLTSDFKLKLAQVKNIKKNNNLTAIVEFLSYVEAQRSNEVLEQVITLLTSGKTLESIKRYDLSQMGGLSKEYLQISRIGLSDLREFIFDIRNRKLIKRVIIISPWITDLQFLQEVLDYSKENFLKIIFFLRDSNENKEALQKLKRFGSNCRVFFNNSLHAKTYIVETSYGFRNFVYIGSSNFSKASSNLEEIGVVAHLEDHSRLYLELKHVIGYLNASKETKTLS